MARLHFFTDISSDLIVQGQTGVPSTHNLAFGPDETLPADKFRVTSLHQWNTGSSSNPKAYAMVAGTVRFQQDTTNTNYLNAVLKVNEPRALKQLPIKYIIYRGIEKSSVLQGPGFTSLVTGMDQNHIAAKILKENPTDQFDSNRLGLGIIHSLNPQPNQTAVNDDEDLDRLFNNNYPFQATKVFAGDILGEFAKSLFGIDIVLESAWQKPEMNVVRSVNLSVGNVISINQSHPANLQRAHREMILSYLDPAAFIGSLLRERWKTNLGSRKGEDLFNEVLEKFKNKSTVYIDVRNNNNLSLNFYGNVGPLGLRDHSSGGVLDRQAYGGSWPIQILDPKYIEPFPGEEKNKIEIGFDKTTTDPEYCFLRFAPIFKEEKLALINRFPKFQKNDKQFHLLTKQNAEDVTEYLPLSAYQVSDSGGNPVAVSFYFRLFYTQDFSGHSITGTDEIGREHILDNLFHISHLNKIEDNVQLQYLTKAWYDGNECYIGANSILGSKVTYPGMYKTGIAIDGNNVTFFAIPFAFNGAAKVPKFINPIGGSRNLSRFFEYFSKKRGKGVTAKEQAISGSGHKYIEFSLGISNDEIDKDAFIAITMTDVEYAAINTELANFSNAFHPIFFQVASISKLSGTSSLSNRTVNYQQGDLQLGGYDLSGNPRYSLGSTIGLPLLNSHEGRLFATTNSVSNQGLTLADRIRGITIKNDPVTESDYYDLLEEALLLVKRWNPELVREAESIIADGLNQFIPTIKEVDSPGNPSHKVAELGSREEHRYYSLSLWMGPLAGADGVTDFDSYVVPADGTVGPYDNAIFAPGFQVGAATGSNYVEYEQFLANSANTPRDIAENFIPKFDVYTPLFDYHHIPAVNKSVIDLLESGLGAQNLTPPSATGDPGIPEIKFNEVTHWNDYYPIGSAVRWGGKKPLEVVNSTGAPIFVLKDYSKKLISAAETIAHELGHFVHQAKYPLTTYAWTLLELHYTRNPTGSVPNAGSGHLPGQPTGNAAGEAEYTFGKNFIEGHLWKLAEPQIRAQVNHGIGMTVDDSIREMKTLILKPEYLVFDNGTGGTNQFIIKPYLEGNLHESYIDIPKV